MKKGAQVVLAPLEVELPEIEAPFAVLIDADDTDWSEVELIRSLGKTLLDYGCRYFVCFGQRSEILHDCLDDLLLDENYNDVVTTFHNDETKEEALDFLINCASLDMNGALVVVRDTTEWEMLKGMRHGRLPGM